MRITFGTAKIGSGLDGIPIVWDASKVMNGHFTIVGPSGSGKTTRLRRLITGMSLINPGVSIVVLDPHGDMAVVGESVVRFSETAEVGLNPLRVSPDPDYGGVRKRVKFFTSIMNRYGRQLGDRQVFAVENLLTELYAKAGFLVDDPETWSLDVDPRRGVVNRKRYPTVSDLRRYAQHKLIQVFLGTSSECVNALDELAKRLQQSEPNRAAKELIDDITRSVRSLEGSSDAVGALEELTKRVRSLDRAVKKEMKGEEGPDVGKLQDKCKELFARFVDHMEDGHEIENVFKLYSRDVLQSCYERLSNLESTGIFKPTPPQFDPSATVRRYDLSALSTDEQKMVVDMVLEDIFEEARRKGQQDHPTTFVVIDEAHKFVTKDEDHVIARVSREARKFGLGLILSSQGLGDFTDAILSQMATRFVLGVDSTFLDATAKKLKIEPKRLASIQIHRTSVIQVRNRGEGSHNWYEMELAG